MMRKIFNLMTLCLVTCCSAPDRTSVTIGQIVFDFHYLDYGFIEKNSLKPLSPEYVEYEFDFLFHKKDEGKNFSFYAISDLDTVSLTSKYASEKEEGFDVRAEFPYSSYNDFGLSITDAPSIESLVKKVIDYRYIVAEKGLKGNHVKYTDAVFTENSKILFIYNDEVYFEFNRKGSKVFWRRLEEHVEVTSGTFEL